MFCSLSWLTRFCVHVPLLLCHVVVCRVENTTTPILDSAVYFLAWQLKNLPVYTLAAKVCPPGACSPTCQPFVHTSGTEMLFASW